MRVEPLRTRVGDFLFEKAMDGFLDTAGGICVLSDWAERNKEESTIARITDGSLNLCGRVSAKVLGKVLRLDEKSKWPE